MLHELWYAGSISALMNGLTVPGHQKGPALIMDTEAPPGEAEGC